MLVRTKNVRPARPPTEKRLRVGNTVLRRENGECGLAGLVLCKEFVNVWIYGLLDFDTVVVVVHLYDIFVVDPGVKVVWVS